FSLEHDLFGKPASTFPDHALSPPAEQEHRLLAEQIPEPPRHFQPHPPAPGIERHRLFHLGAGDMAERTEILDAAEVDIRRLPPRMGQIVGLRYVAAERDLQPYLPVAEIRERDNPMTSDAQHVLKHDARLAGGLQ